MCGIVGIIEDRSTLASLDVLRAMRDTLSHRGPDDAGEFLDGHVALGHRRLSIIDASSAGHQPMLSDNGRYALVFNGEIYNYRELREEYLTDVDLVSSSDTEVLLHLLIKKGKDALPLLKGMFAFAFWDRYKDELLLATDPFGKKPLYYTWHDNALLFASEPKAFLKYPGFVSAMDKEDASRYFLHEYVPAPGSGLSGVSRLPMGSVGIKSAESFVVEEWWRPAFMPKHSSISESKALGELDELLGRAVERRLVADVPVGIFLSGGLDSTTILWYMQKMKDEIHSCSVSFKEQTFDESEYIKLVADGTVHHGMKFGAEDVALVLSELSPLMDVPLADASLLPTYAVSKLAREHMKVVLSGDGADELFGGYGTFVAGSVAEYLDVVPRATWRMLERGLARVPVSHEYFSFDFKVKSFLKGMGYSWARRNQIWLGSFSRRELGELFVGNVDGVYSALDAQARDARELSLFDRISYMTVREYLQDDILVKLDRATMMTGLEARTPFLDVDLAEFVMRLPEKLKRNKYLMKTLMRGRIPDEIIDRKKKGFGIPLGSWFLGELRPWLLGTLSEERVKATGVLNFIYVKKLLAHT